MPQAAHCCFLLLQRLAHWTLRHPRASELEALGVVWLSCFFLVWTAAARSETETDGRALQPMRETHSAFVADVSVPVLPRKGLGGGGMALLSHSRAAYPIFKGSILHMLLQPAGIPV